MISTTTFHPVAAQIRRAGLWRFRATASDAHLRLYSSSAASAFLHGRIRHGRRPAPCAVVPRFGPSLKIVERPGLGSTSPARGAMADRRRVAVRLREAEGGPADWPRHPARGQRVGTTRPPSLSARGAQGSSGFTSRSLRIPGSTTLGCPKVAGPRQIPHARGACWLVSALSRLKHGFVSRWSHHLIPSAFWLRI
jgi:hypothetical protein